MRAPSFLPDSSWMIASLSSWHEHHERARREVEDRLERKFRLIMAVPALVECYSVLTRLPEPFRISSRDAADLLTQNYRRLARFVTLSPADTWQVLHDLSRFGFGGGLTYDAIILACARNARATELLTVNERDFQRFPNAGVRIVGLGQEAL